MIYRVFQELLNNIVKHSAASKASISSRVEEGTLTIEIKDNGKGLPTDLWEKSDNLGLKNIKSRVNYLGGNITLDNSDGTFFHIQIPEVLL